MQGKLLSIIVPVYNVESYLKECLDSIVNQNYKNVEVLLINDGSTDSSKKICENYAKKYKNFVLINQKNSGVSAARNVGIKKAKGDLITFVDSDDVVDENIYFDNINYLNHCDLLTFGWNLYYKNGKVQSGVCQEQKMKRKEALKMIINDNNSSQGYLWNKIFKADIVIKNNILFDENIKICEDLLFVVNYLQNCEQIQTVTKTYYNYRMRISAVSKKFDINKYKTMLETYSKLIKVWEDNKLANTNVLKYEYLTNYYFYKEIYQENNIGDMTIINSFLDVLKDKNISFQKRIRLFNIKYFRVFIKIKNRLSKSHYDLFD